MIRKVIIESINYDYLPGEPESRKTWFFTLKEPSHVSLFNKIVYVKSINTPNAMFADNYFFHVYDVHGRSLVVEPVKPPTFNTNISNYVELLNGTGRDPIIGVQPERNNKLVGRSIPHGFTSNEKFITTDPWRYYPISKSEDPEYWSMSWNFGSKNHVTPSFPKVPVIIDQRDVYPRMGVDVYSHRPTSQIGRPTSNAYFSGSIY